MANNAMGMMMMLLMLGGAAVLFAKRCEWLKICDDGPKFKEGPVPRFVDQVKSIEKGKLMFNPAAKVTDDLEVTVPQADGSLKVFNPQPTSKFARISYV